MIATINETLFPIFLFIIVFSVCCCTFYTPQTQAEITEEIESIDEFAISIKEAFSTEYDPISDNDAHDAHDAHDTEIDETEVHHNTIVVNSVNPINSPKNETVQRQPININEMTIRDLRQYVRDSNLQATIKQVCGKTISKCRKKEIIQALNT